MNLTIAQIETIIRYGHVVSLHIQAFRIVKAVRNSQILAQGLKGAEKATLEMLEKQYASYFNAELVLDASKILYEEHHIRDFTLTLLARIVKRKQEHVLM